MFKLMKNIFKKRNLQICIALPHVRFINLAHHLMGAVVSGITEHAEMTLCLTKKIDFYSEHYGIKRYPSKPTLNRILNMDNGDSVGLAISDIMRENAHDIGEIIAVDGKAIRSTGKKSCPKTVIRNAFPKLAVLA